MEAIIGIIIFIIIIIIGKFLETFENRTSKNTTAQQKSTIKKQQTEFTKDNKKQNNEKKQSNIITKSYPVTKNKINYPNANKIWTAKEDLDLKKLYSNGVAATELAKTFGRNIEEVNLRIKQLRLKYLELNEQVEVTNNYNFYLYHFTDPRNLQSIKKYGLLSWEQLLNKNIIHYPASNDLSRNLDRRYNLEDYVRLSLNQNHPMFSAALYYGRVKSLVWLKVKPSVIDLPGTLFSNTNATCNHVVINQIKDTALKSNDIQAEVLVKERIDPTYIIFDAINDSTFYNKSNQSIIYDDDDLPF